MTANTIDPAAYEEAADEIERLRLTAEEREAIECTVFGTPPCRSPQLTTEEREALIVASIELNALGMFEGNHSAALRGLLERAI